jgi:hypothetical protein
VIAVQNAEHLVCPSTSKRDKHLDRVKKLVLRNRRITMCKVANMVGISFGSAQSILKDNVNTSQMPTKFMSHLLSEKQKENHVHTYQDPQEA